MNYFKKPFQNLQKTSLSLRACEAIFFYMLLLGDRRTSVRDDTSFCKGFFKSKRHARFLKLSMSLIVFILGFSIGVHAQITTNNALPVGEGKAIFRVQNKIIRATGDPTSTDRELLVQAFPVVGVYGITPRLTVFGVVPVLDKILSLTTPQGRISRGGDFGLGDARLFARYDVYRKSSRGKILSFSPFGGAELPTGANKQRDEFGRVPPKLQRGSGSVDPFFGAVLTYQTLQWFFDAATSYQINTEANNFEFGDEYRLDGVVKYRLFPRELRSGVPGFFYILLESNLIIQDNNEVNGISNLNSGGTTWFADPGLQYITRKFVFEGAIQLPVVQDLNGNALETNFITTLSVRINI